MKKELSSISEPIVQMPNSLELENEILGALLESNHYHDLIFSNLQAIDFYNSSNQQIFEIAINLKKQDIPIDNITVIQEVNKIQKTNEGINADYVLNLISQLASTANLEYHIILLKNISISRSALHIFKEKQKAIIENVSPGSEILSESIKEFEELLNRLSINKTRSFNELYFETLKSLGKSSSDQLGLSTGFKKLDSVTSGICAPDLTILAAGPGEGKSTFALNIAHYIASTAGKVLIFSFEMKSEQLIYKLISNESNQTVKNVRMGIIPSDFHIKCTGYKANLRIFDSGDYTIDQIVSISKIENNSEPVKLIVIDYLQLISIGIYQTKNQTRNDQISIITRLLKKLAMKINVPIIALSQINRDKTRKTYRLFDLRESGAIEQDADNVWFIWRPFTHDQHSYEIAGNEINVNEQTSIFIIEKNRLGQTGEFEMKFIGEYSRFEDIDSPSVKTPF